LRLSPVPAFLYSVLLTCLTPTTPIVLLLVAAFVFRRHAGLARGCHVGALAVLLLCGNGWIVGALVRSLESANPPAPPAATADVIIILSGGTLPQVPPRTTVEISDAGDRVLYGAELFRQQRAPRVVVTGDVGTGGLAPRPAADDMADLLHRMGVPPSAIVTERAALNTHDHAVNLCPMLTGQQVRRVLLVTSALHMRRSLGVFRHSCPSLEYIPAPTDFRAVDDVPGPWYRQAARIIPTPSALQEFSEAAHEYLGLVYYRARGWL
jgi:uncharacterized SAM-binding protein YcdF (DUF218 family)